MFTQPRDLNIKTYETAYLKYCSYCHRRNHSISACFKRQRDDDDKREAKTFVLPLMIEQNDMIHDIEESK